MSIEVVTDTEDNASIEPTTPKPLIEFWREGLMSTKELLQAAEPLPIFLRRMGLALETRFYKKVVTVFEPTGAAFDKQVSVSLRSAIGYTGRYFVDTELMVPTLPQLQTLVKSLEDSHKPDRTPEEKEYYRKKILRRESGIGYTPITLDQACEELLRRACLYFNKSGFYDKADDLAQIATLRSLSYLRGERYDFDSLDQFCKKFYRRILKSVKINALKAKRKDAITNYDLEQISDTTEPKIDKVDKIVLSSLMSRIAELDDTSRQIIILRAEGFTWPVITSELGYPIANTPNIRARYHRLLAMLSSPRTVDARRIAYSNVELLEAYTRLRSEIRESGGKEVSKEDIRRARREGRFICSVETLVNRFGGQNWSATHRKLAALIPV